MWFVISCARRIAILIAVALSVPVARAADFHLLRAEGGFVAAFQASGGNSQTGFLAYTPAWETEFGFGVKIRIGGALYRAQSGGLIVATDVTGFLLWKFRDVPFQLEAGGGAEVWFATPQSYNPAVAAQVGYVFQEPLLIFDRWFFGYRLTLLSGVPTHAGYLGIGVGI